ncbi:MAG TPA: hypothetical protein VGR76_19910 [Candidatus Angelobacter sp.]|nr:hypothetical protein [Candidatus Angelobacter sp.]
MSRRIFIIPFLAFALQVSQAQFVTHGPPASVTSPTPDGQLHGVPSSVTSPTRLPFGVNPPLRPGIRIHGPFRRFGNPHGPRRQVFVSIPVFYPIYADNGYPSVADPYVPEAPADPAARADSAPAADAAPARSEDELRAAYLQGAHDAMSRQEDSRYGEHYMDSRERRQQNDPPPKSSTNEVRAAAPPTPVEDKSPATIFIFKDGHQMETKNYAIMGGTLFDFSGKMLKKIQIDELDSAATIKANDDRGVVMKLN